MAHAAITQTRHLTKSARAISGASDTTTLLTPAQRVTAQISAMLERGVRYIFVFGDQTMGRYRAIWPVGLAATILWHAVSRHECRCPPCSSARQLKVWRA